MNALEWLLDADPAIRWQAMRDLTDAPAEQVATERARVATEGWGARLLALRPDGGLWDLGTPDTEWASLLALLLLRDMGLDPSSQAARTGARIAARTADAAPAVEWRADRSGLHPVLVSDRLPLRRVARPRPPARGRRDGRCARG